MGIASVLRRISSPLLQVGDLAFDSEVSVQRGLDVQFTENRIGAGVSLSDHSFAKPRVYMITGAVSGIAQLQNIGRPGFNGAEALADLGLGLLEGLTGLNFSSRVEDFEARLIAAMEARNEFELISKVVGRRRVIILNYTSTTGAEDGDSATFQLTLKEVQRAGLTIADAIDAALALNGSGGGSQGGPSTTTPYTGPLTPG